MELIYLLTLLSDLSTFFFPFLVEFAHTKAAVTQIYWIQANTYTEDNPYMFYYTNIFSFRCLQERIL